MVNRYNPRGLKRSLVKSGLPLKTTVDGEIWLFELPFLLQAQFKPTATSQIIKFSVRVGEMTLGDVLAYLLKMVGGPVLRLDPPWNAIEKIRLDKFAFVAEISNGVSSYGFSYTDLGIDLGFAQFDKLEVLYSPFAAKSEAVPKANNEALNVNVFGSFLGISFHDKPISWDALKEAPPQSPTATDKVLRLDYLGLGQRVTLRDISDLDTVGKVMAELRNSYRPIPDGTLNPMGDLPNLEYDERAAWLVGANFSLLETFDFQGLWNLPKLAGARIGLRGERAKSLAGFEFEILYRKIAEDLGQYHIELVLPDVLRRFQAGAASVTLPIIAVEIYTDGGFKIDLGFPKDLNFERSFAIELMIGPIPVTGALGLYFGRLSPQAVPGIPAITGGSFGPVIIAGAGFRIGVGKSIKAGILEAGFFLGIEGLIEGVLGFFEPYDKSDPKAVYFRCSGTLQLTGHIYGKIDFAIISAAVDIYAYISVQANFEVYRATVLVFEAGVKVSLEVKINLGFFKIPIELSFSATIRQEAVIGQDEATPWQIAAEVGTALKDRLGPVAYRHLPTGEIVADRVFLRLLDPHFDAASALAAMPDDERPSRLAKPDKPVPFELFFRPITALGTKGDFPGGKLETQTAEVNLVASLMLRLSRGKTEPLAPAELYATLVLRWALGQVRDLTYIAGAQELQDEVTLSELEYFQKHFDGAVPPIEVTPSDIRDFFTDWAVPQIREADWTGDAPGLTPFPMIPFLTMSTGEGETTLDSFNFEDGPLCSEKYQQEIREYFDNLNQMRDASAPVKAGVIGDDGKELSMSELIFIDSFKLVLKSVVSEAIEALRLVEVTANGLSFDAIAALCGIGHPAGLARITDANIDNKAFFKPSSSITIAADGAQIARRRNLLELSNHLGRPRLDIAKAIYTQPILDPDAEIALDGVRHQINAADRADGISHIYGVSWQEIKDFNPGVDWSVPREIKDSPYPTLRLPVGTWLRLPTIKVSGSTLIEIAEKYAVSVSDVTATPKAVRFAAEGLAQIGLKVAVREGDTIEKLAKRFDGVTMEQIARNILFDPSMLQTGLPITVPIGEYIIGRGDTLDSIAMRLQTSTEAIRSANAQELWRLLPRPGTDETLPMGVTIALPAVASFMPKIGDSFASIARLFGIDPLALAVFNAKEFALPVQAEVTLPPFDAATGAEPPSPAVAAQKFGIPAQGLIRANQGSVGGQAAAAPINIVKVPECEKIAEETLITKLANAPGGSRLAASAQAQSRFIMAGLRLPDPAAKPGAPSLSGAGGVAPIEKPLWPLYTLSGQQWPAPAAPSEAYWVKLSWNDSPQAKRMATSLTPLVPPPVKAFLTKADTDLIEQFRTVSVDTAAIQPTVIARSPYPAFQQIKVEQTFGAATPWSIPVGVTFVALDPATPPKAVDAPMLLDVPQNLRSLLPVGNAKLAPLEISQTTPDPVSGQPVRRPLANIGWATRIDLNLREAFGSDSGGDPLDATYETVSIEAQGQADLEGLRAYIYDHHAGKPVDLYMLYPGDPLGPVPGAMRSDAIAGAARAKIALLKSNLSTFSNPATTLSKVAMHRDEEAGPGPSSATLDQGRDFLDLLWQISVTNGGGFFLNYEAGPDGPGLPSSLFETGSSATVSIVAVLREEDGKPAAVAPARCHNVLITAENLASADATVQAVAASHSVTIIEGSDPTATQSLGEIATKTGITNYQLARLNQSNHALLITGQVIAIPDGASHKVKPGDDLLSVANQLGAPFDTLVDVIAPQTGLLAKGAILAVRPGWVCARNAAEPEQGGFNILRSQPLEPLIADAPTGFAAEKDAIDDVKFRIGSMFQMMGYRLAEENGFSASHEGLAILPDVPDKDDPDKHYIMAGDAPQPFVYRRLLPIASFAGSGIPNLIDFTDPYRGLGRNPVVSFGFQDIFGNRLPRAGASDAVSWMCRYRDPLIPLHGWPSVTISYDTEYEKTNNSPQVIIRIKFAPAGYGAELGTTAAQLHLRAQADQKRYGLIYYQVADQRVDVGARTTLTGEKIAGLNSGRLATFAADAFDYLTAIGELQPVKVELSAETTIRSLARASAVSDAQITQHLARQPCILRERAKIYVPEFATTLPNSSLETIAQSTKNSVTPADIGRLNAKVVLAEAIVIDVGGEDYETKRGDSLERISRRGPSVEEIAASNTEVEGLFPAETDLSLGIREVTVTKDDMLGTIAASQAVPLEALALANLDRSIFASGKLAELPLHMTIPQDTPCTAAVKDGQKLCDFIAEYGASLRDVLTANSANTGLLKTGQFIKYRATDDDPEQIVKIRREDTLATIALVIAAKTGNPSLKPADIGSYPANANNPKLLVGGALMLLPPIRFFKHIDVPDTDVRKVTVDRLGVEIFIERNDPTLIDPAFIDAPEVRRVTSTIPARLSSKHSQDRRGSLRAFAEEFQDAFEDLRLAIGPDIFSSVDPHLLDDEKAEPEPESKLVAVQWGQQKGFFAKVTGAPTFFAPRPLRTRPWNGVDVPISPYVPGEPLATKEDGNPVPTNFNSADLERWAGLLLGRIDRILKPDLAAPLRQLAPDQFAQIIKAKATIADAVAKRVETVLEHPADAPSDPNQASAAEQLKQQLLVELGNTYRGGVVVQYDVEGSTPPGSVYTQETAPRLLCSLSAVTKTVPLDNPTLTGVARLFETPDLFTAELIEHVHDLLVPGYIVPLGTKPKVGPNDTIATIIERAGSGITLAKFVNKMANIKGLLKPGANVPLAEREMTAEGDESIGSAIEQLAPNLMAKGLEDAALKTFLDLNEKPGVFVPGIVFEWEGKSSPPTSEHDSFGSVAGGLGADPVALYYQYWACAPFLAQGVTFRFLARIPPVTVSASKITLFSGPGTPNKMNCVVVNTAPDEASSIPLQLKLEPQALEYNIHDVGEGGGYQASEWLTFVVDLNFGKTLDPISLPVPNRQFPLSPQILSHSVKPQVQDGSVNPAEIEKILAYDYRLNFAFDAATQDEITYTRYTDFAAAKDRSTHPLADIPDGEKLAPALAQYQAIDEALWADVYTLRSWEQTPPSEEQRKVAANAVSVFAKLAEDAAIAWLKWDDEGAPPIAGDRYSIRRHDHPSGASTLCVTPHDAQQHFAGQLESQEAGEMARTLPQARIMGRKYTTIRTDLLTVTALETAEPQPKTRGGKFYEVLDPGLNVLTHQRCWGGISVLRNRRLVSGAQTNSHFILHVPDVRSETFLTPSLTYAQRIDLGHEIATLADRLKVVLERVYFPSSAGVLPPNQRASVTMAYTRPLASAGQMGEAEPADWRSLFAPVAATPIIELELDGAGGPPTPAVMANQIAAHLDAFLTAENLAPSEKWSFTLKLFSQLGDNDSPPQLLEILDIRMRMSDQ